MPTHRAGRKNRAPLIGGCDNAGTCDCTCGNAPKGEVKLPSGTVLTQPEVRRGCAGVRAGDKRAKHCGQHRARCHVRCKK